MKRRPPRSTRPDPPCPYPPPFLLLMDRSMLLVCPASAQGVTGMLDGLSEASKAGVDFLVLLALLVGVGAILFGLKLVVDKSNDRADVKNSHIAASLIGGSFLCMIWFVITVLVETAGGSSGDIGAADRKSVV